MVRRKADALRPVYGPVPSWRLGASLGVDLQCSRVKVCTFNCIYCQLGARTHMTLERSTFVPTKRLLGLLEEHLQRSRTRPDVITFSGTGEPTLAKNMGEVLAGVRELTDSPVAILTNSSLIHDPDVTSVLKGMDIVVAKLDAPDEDLFKAINRPIKGISFDDIVDPIKDFRKGYKGSLRLQMMFMKENMERAQDMAELALEIGPDEVQVNTPLRECDVEPLSSEELDRIEPFFKGLRTLSVHKASRPDLHVDDPKGLEDRGRPKGEVSARVRKGANTRSRIRKV